MKRPKRIKRVFAGILSVVMLVGLIGPVKLSMAETEANSGPIVLESSATTPSASIGDRFTIKTLNAEVYLPEGTYYNAIKLNGYDTGDAMELYSEGNGSYQIVHWGIVQVGAVLSLEGTYSRNNVKLTFPKTEFTLQGDETNGYYWKLDSDAIGVQVTDVSLIDASKTEGAGNNLRVKFTTGTALPRTETTFQRGVGAVLNHNGEWMDAYLYGHPDIPYYQIIMDDVVPQTKAGDVITIAGTFQNTDGSFTITFPETTFVCRGDATKGYYWKLKGEPDVLQADELVLTNASKTASTDNYKRIQFTTGTMVPDEDTVFQAETDAVLTRNGEWMDAYLYGHPDIPYYQIVMDDAIPATAAGDVITIGGTFVSRDGKWSIELPTMNFRCMQDESSDCYWMIDYGTKAVILSPGQLRDADFNFTSPDTQEIPVDDVKLQALNELDSGIYVNGEKHSGTLTKIDTTSFELDLKSHAAQNGDIITVQGSFATDEYIVSFQHFTVQYKQGVWSTVDTASGKVTMPDTVVDLERIPEGYLTEEGSTVITDKGAVFTEEVIQKPGNYIFSRTLGNIQYVKKVVVYRKGDVHIDDILNVKDLIAMLKVQEDASNYGEAEKMASEVLQARTADENREALRNMLVNNGIYVPKGTPTYADDIYIELAAYCGPRRAGYRFWNGSEGGHPEDPEGGWNSFFTEKNFQDYMDAGFTYLMAEGDANYSSNFEGSTLQAYMELAEKMDIPVLVCSGEVVSMASGTSHQLTQENKDYLVQLLKDLSVYRSFKGLTLRDEPSIANVKAFGSIQDYIWARDPDFFFYTCMLPIYAETSDFSATELENKDVAYQEYIRSFANATKSFAYDYYPLWSEPKEGSLLRQNFVRTDYYHNFELVARDAKRNAYNAGIVVQSSSWGEKDEEKTSTHPRKTNTKADIGFQVYSALAYGMKYINYYTYWEHWSQSDSSYVYDAMVLYPENKGEEPIKTDTYYAVQAVNQEIKKFDHIFLRYDWQGSMAVVPNKASKSELLSGVQDYKSSRISEVTATQETLIGCMKDENGYDGFWIVNAIEPSKKSTDSVTIEFKQASSAICYIEGEEQRIELQDGKVTFNLDAGEGIFVIPVQ